MNLEFDLGSVKLAEFGVGRDDGSGPVFVAVSVDEDVQGALREMAVATRDAMLRDSAHPAQYSPSEKHASIEYLHVPLEHAFASSIRLLHEAANLDVDANALADPDDLFCYFARFVDKADQRLTALRRATHFKGVVKKRLLRLSTDALRLIEDQVFKLDNDFDLLVDGTHVHILRPSGFEFAGKLQQAILDAVPDSVKAIQADLDFVDFGPISEYASQHPRAARYLASIRGQQNTENIDPAALKELCARTDVDVGEVDGTLTVSAGHEMGFLEVLDRRRYELLLVREQPERYRASSRSKIDG